MYFKNLFAIKEIDLKILQLTMNFLHLANNIIKRDCFSEYAYHSNRKKIENFCKHLKKASIAWKKKRYENNKKNILHDISYNYWVRSYSVDIYNKTNGSYIWKKFAIWLYIFFSIPLTVFSWIFNYLIKSNYICGVLLSDNKKKLKHQKSFLTYTNEKRLKRLRMIQFSDSINLIKGNIISIALKSQRNLDRKNYIFCNKLDNVEIIKNIIAIFLYLLENPNLWIYRQKLLDSINIYSFIRNYPDTSDFDSFHEEIYCFNTRAVALACIDNGNHHKLLEYMSINDYYDIYYLRRNKKTFSYHDISKQFLPKDTLRKYKIDPKTFVIQASDTFSNMPTSYEFCCYREIAKKIPDIDGFKVFIVFHPANSKFSIKLKKYFWMRILKNFKYTNIIFKYREETIEEIICICNASKLLTIDISSCIITSLNLKIKVIHFNYGGQRHKSDIKLNIESKNYLYLESLLNVSFE
tara:strand:- start:3713 stop:5110 length:1398 start_codon:yes stop_codon:yes gene_type:complete